MVEQQTNTLFSCQDSWKVLRAIRDDEQIEFIHRLDLNSYLWNDISEEFLENFTSWVKMSKLNDFSKIDSYPHKTITCGSIQAFDHWYISHGGMPEVVDGEFMYHKGANKNSNPFLSNKNRILSMPFTGNGQIHELYDEWIESEIPLMLDFCHAPTSKGLILDDNDCIKQICFSVSKAFWGGEWLRIGVRYSKLDYDDGIDIANHVKMVPRLSMGVTNELIKEYEFDSAWNRNGFYYDRVCERLNLKKTNNVMFALGDSEYDNYNRAGYNRICLSQEIYNEKTIT